MVCLLVQVRDLCVNVSRNTACMFTHITVYDKGAAICGDSVENVTPLDARSQFFFLFVCSFVLGGWVGTKRTMATAPLSGGFLRTDKDLSPHNYLQISETFVCDSITFYLGIWQTEYSRVF